MSSFQVLLLFPWSIEHQLAKFSPKDSSKDFSLTKEATKFFKFSGLEIVSSLKVIPSLQSTFSTILCAQKAKFIIYCYFAIPLNKKIMTLLYNYT